MKSFSIIRKRDYVENRNPYNSANKNYHLVWVELDCGSTVPCLLTEHNLTTGIERARTNPEDIRPLSTIQRIIVKLFCKTKRA